MGLASAMVMAYGAKQGVQVLQQLNQSQSSPYPQQGQGYGAPPQGQAASYYQQGAQQQQQAQGGHYQPNYAAAQNTGYNPAYAAAGAAAGAAYAAHGAGQGAQPTGDVGYILRTLQTCVVDQNLQAFYPPGSLDSLAHRIAASGALQRIASEWRLPMELAHKIAMLSLFDVVLYLDDSGSMAFEENGSRIDDAKMICSRVATAASLFDTDGISVVTMNSPMVGNGITSEAQANQLISHIQFSGLTPIGTSLDQKVLQQYVVGPARANALRKPPSLTAREPAGEDRYALVKAVQNAKAALQQTRYGPDALSLEIAQARAFLAEIDSHPSIGGLVDCTSTFEIEQDEALRTTGIQISPELYLLKLICGGIDVSLDSKDERR
ncbi:hypothetical protein JCM10213v2_008150 [Rhodosporidiobolus nylandii]